MSELKFVFSFFFSHMCSEKVVYVQMLESVNSCKNIIWVLFCLIYFVRLFACYLSVKLQLKGANIANSAHFNIQDGQFKKIFQLCKCDLEDRKK